MAADPREGAGGASGILVAQERRLGCITGLELRPLPSGVFQMLVEAKGCATGSRNAPVCSARDGAPCRARTSARAAAERVIGGAVSRQKKGDGRVAGRPPVGSAAFPVACGGPREPFRAGGVRRPTRCRCAFR
ncbi:hypothetical protein DK419_11225 [Methylobacterium terrae]|uniref:Uncharacterized protein n=1 Tax=Methylobacterium terrae TaxID=2202827 RepID=A0A2U8WMK5_9HYPH|nr:hypothetical protein DK419_11225 [Methylobacterium terrae]